MYYDELTAGSKDEAAAYFNEHKRDDVTLIRVELIGPDDNGVGQLAGSPVAPLTTRPMIDAAGIRTSVLPTEGAIMGLQT